MWGVCQIQNSRKALNNIQNVIYQDLNDDAITVEAREIDDSKALPAAIQETSDYDYSPDFDETCCSPDYQQNSAVFDDCYDYHVDSGEDPDDPRTWIYSFSLGFRSLALIYLEEIHKWKNEVSGLTDYVGDTAYKEQIKYNIQNLKRSLRKAFDDHRYIIDATEHKAFLKRKYGEIPGVTYSIPFAFAFKEKKQLREVVFHVQIFDTADTDFAGKCPDWKIKYYGSKYIQFSNDNGTRCLVYFPSQDVFQIFNEAFGAFCSFNHSILRACIKHIRKELPKIMKHFGLLDDNGEFISDGNEAFRVQLYKEFIQHRKNNEAFDAESFVFSDAAFSSVSYQRDNPISWHHHSFRDKALRVYFRLLFTHHDLWEMAHSESNKKTYRHECEILRDEIHSLFEKQCELQEKEKKKKKKKPAPQISRGASPCPICYSTLKPLIRKVQTSSEIITMSKCRECGYQLLIKKKKIQEENPESNPDVKMPVNNARTTREHKVLSSEDIYACSTENEITALLDGLTLNALKSWAKSLKIDLHHKKGMSNKSRLAHHIAHMVIFEKKCREHLMKKRVIQSAAKHDTLNEFYCTMDEKTGQFSFVFC